MSPSPSRCSPLRWPPAATGPIRVLHLGTGGTNTTRHAHVFMRDLGRDAIWFDYISDPAVVTPEWIAKFDAVLLDAPKDSFKALAGVDAKRIITGDFTGQERNWATGLRDTVLATVGDARKKDWEAFLAQREPEKRAANPNVANYERRPEALTVPEPFSVKGSTVGPALDGIATRATPAYIKESLLEPSKVIAKGFEALGTLSPMPPMGDIFNEQELADIQTYLQTLK